MDITISSDLLISGEEVPGAVATGKTAKIVYDIGAAEGPVLYGRLEFAGFTVTSQAFFHTTANKTNPLPAPGIIGLGPFVDSQVVGTLTTSTKDIHCWKIFFARTRLPPTISPSCLAGWRMRTITPGDLTVIETLTGLGGIHNQPRIPAQTAVHHDQRWSVLIDEDAFFDTGQVHYFDAALINLKPSFTYPQVPVNVAEAVYGSFKDAKLETISGQKFWTVSCEEEVDITFKIGYRINPWDATFPLSAMGIDREDRCFQGITPSSQDVDMILGMAFLRTLLICLSVLEMTLPQNSMVRVLNGVDNVATAFIQLLSTSNDTVQLHAEFVKARLSGGSSSASKDLDASQIKQDVNSIGHKVEKGIIIGAVVGGCYFPSLPAAVSVSAGGAAAALKTFQLLFS
ncbi:hypothetical protein PILCRDRAFT_8610 [Piloderma croceum F 1598]|uniref:Peptidase A1 domain-containing protein n=1 Tax=Piloderma croceum (strain F 1598) TaxID=765440 RepID=A0A0C3BW04_PILCF|nr:hypothetical protein PILCRDRAFT_8610 [Piloderma croceum F 1598]